MSDQIILRHTRELSCPVDDMTVEDIRTLLVGVPVRAQVNLEVQTLRDGELFDTITVSWFDEIVRS